MIANSGSETLYLDKTEKCMLWALTSIFEGYALFITTEIELIVIWMHL